jgi:hypothetical protein
MDKNEAAHLLAKELSRTFTDLKIGDSDAKRIIEFLEKECGMRLLPDLSGAIITLKSCLEYYGQEHHREALERIEAAVKSTISPD